MSEISEHFAKVAGQFTQRAWELIAFTGRQP
jgi:hypothetical protein